jgi:glycosyltransferase involved in cell wall biosynthesis
MLARALQREHDLLFLSFRRQYPRLLFPGRTDRDPSRSPLRCRSVRYVLDSLRPSTWERTVGIIRHHRPDAVLLPWWVPFWTPQYFYLMKRLHMSVDGRIIALCHNVQAHEGGVLKSLCTRLVLSQADRVVTQSHEESLRVRQLLGDRMDVVTAFHPVYDQFKAQLAPRAAARRRLGLTGDVLLFMGFVRPYKGLHVLLQALAHLTCEREITLVVAGEFWKGKEDCLTAIEQLGLRDRVVLVDRYIPNEEVGWYFSAADLAVLPYLSGTGSGVCQLAFGMGTPVVASRVGSMADAVQDGVNGRLVEPGRPRELAEAIRRALDPEELDRLVRGTAIARKEYSWDRFTRVLLSPS